MATDSAVVNKAKKENIEIMEGLEFDEEGEAEDILLPEAIKIIQKMGKHTVSAFFELYSKVFRTVPVVEFVIVPSKIVHDRKLFLARVNMAGTFVIGRAYVSKKATRESLAKRGMNYLVETYVLDASENVVREIEMSSSNALNELIRQHTLSKFSQLSKNDPRLSCTDKVISSIFLLDSVNKKMHLVSLATGNKCIQGSELRENGQRLFDCHAEILARRGFLRVLYSETRKFLRNPDNSILKLNAETGKLCLREYLTVHQFISTAPCGDGRVYTFDSPSKQARFGLLRHKIDQGMGAVVGSVCPDEWENMYQTMDGIQAGDRLKTMSCSDKLLRWNVLGMQGSLLSTILDPVYPSSLIVGEQLKEHHLERAVSTRLDKYAPPAPFRLNIPFIGGCEELEDMKRSKDITMRNSSIASNWNISDDTIEVISTTNGLMPLPCFSNGKEQKDTSMDLDELASNTSQSAESDDTDRASRLCKKRFAEMYLLVCSEMSRKVPDGWSYENLKGTCDEYEAARKNMEQWMFENKMGRWFHKPEEVTLFDL